MKSLFEVSVLITESRHEKAPQVRGFLSGYPSWIRTMNDRVRICNVTVTLRGSEYGTVILP